MQQQFEDLKATLALFQSIMWEMDSIMWKMGSIFS